LNKSNNKLSQSISIIAVGFNQLDLEKNIIIKIIHWLNPTGKNALEKTQKSKQALTKIFYI
jgi:hypothetical protein